jgi:magnesium chelatase family protein
MQDGAMPLSIASSTLVGIRGAPVEVEVDVATGIPAVRIVGLPDAAVGEARERIRSAIITAEAASEFGLPLAFVTAPYGAKSAVGGLSWLARAAEPTLLPPDVLPPQLLVDDQGLRAWLRVCAASLREDRTVRAPQDTLPAAAPTPGGLRGLILHALGRAGAAGLTEGDLLGVSEGVEGALPSALTLLALQGLAEQRGGRWRVCEGAVLRSRA